MAGSVSVFCYSSAAGCGVLSALRLHQCSPASLVFGVWTLLFESTLGHYWTHDSSFVQVGLAE